MVVSALVWEGFDSAQLHSGNELSHQKTLIIKKIVGVFLLYGGFKSPNCGFTGCIRMTGVQCLQKLTDNLTYILNHHPPKIRPEWVER